MDIDQLTNVDWFMTVLLRCNVINIHTSEGVWEDARVLYLRSDETTVLMLLHIAEEARRLSIDKRSTPMRKEFLVRYDACRCPVQMDHVKKRAGFLNRCGVRRIHFCRWRLWRFGKVVIRDTLGRYCAAYWSWKQCWATRCERSLKDILMRYPDSWEPSENRWSHI